MVIFETSAVAATSSRLVLLKPMRRKLPRAASSIAIRFELAALALALDMYSTVQSSGCVLASPVRRRQMLAHLEKDGSPLWYDASGAGPRVLGVDPALGSSAMRPLDDAL